MSSSPKLLEYQVSQEPGHAELRLDTEKRSANSVSPLLFGKFCEHLGSNIYHGMEAQILFTGTFSKWRFSAGDNHPDGGVREESDSERITQLIQARAHRMGWPDHEPVRAAYFSGSAFGWFRNGTTEQVVLSPDVGPHGERAQRVEVLVGQHGIGQWTHLPLHRTRGFELRLVGRAVGEPAAVNVWLAPLVGDDAVSCEIRLGTEWQTHTARLAVPDGWPADALYQFTVASDVRSHFVLDRALLYPDDHVNGADPEILGLLRDSALPLLRWPGGNFVSGYHWQDGVGPVDARPTVPNPAWEGMEFNTFGTDEFVAYCREVGCVPMICVNAGNGSAQEAADWVEYCNGAADTPMGKLRAANGHSEPHNVRYWEIGNEIYGRWQVGWTTPQGNADRYRRFREAMLVRDPGLHIIGCGQGNAPNSEWNHTLIDSAGETLQSITDHILTGGSVDADTDPVELYHAFLGYITELERRYTTLRQHMLQAGISEPRLAITELQLFAHFRGEVKPQGKLSHAILPRQDSISEALYYTTIVNGCIRLDGFVEMLTHSATVNHGGGLRKDRERTWANPVYHARTIATALAGGTPVAVDLTCEAYSTIHAFGAIPSLSNVPVLDPVAVVTEDGDLLLLIVHRGGTCGPIRLSIHAEGLTPASPIQITTLVGENWHARNTLTEPDKVSPQLAEAQVTDEGLLELDIAPFSLTLVHVSGK